MINFDRAAVQTAVAIAALSTLVVGIVNLGFDEAKHRIAARREKGKNS